VARRLALSAREQRALEGTLLRRATRQPAPERPASGTLWRLLEALPRDQPVGVVPSRAVPTVRRRLRRYLGVLALYQVYSRWPCLSSGYACTTRACWWGSDADAAGGPGWTGRFAVARGGGAVHLLAEAGIVVGWPEPPA
jgi:hypothetical protein